MAGDMPYGCGWCIPCRITKQRIWVHRLMLEAYSHDTSLFITLTYEDENLPIIDEKPCLKPVDPQLWIKRLRRAIQPRKLRYYLVGEYGSKTQRPHYHLALYGAKVTDIPLIDKTWGLGFAHYGDVTVQSARYILGYVTKKMTKSDDPRLEGRYPEFSRSSNRPGIGAPAMQILAETLFTKHGKNEIEILGDVPSQLRHGKKTYPLGRYLQQKLRDNVGMPDDYSQTKRYTYSLELQALRQASDPSKAKSLQEIITDANHQRRLQVEGLYNIRNSEKTL